MARRPLSFGVRLRDPDRDITLRIRAAQDGCTGYVIEHDRADAPTRQHVHASLAEAVRDGARIWRHRLN